ncbi:MAG: hypothetical protein IJ412_03515 [Oscillospiraceae bacterium]|nr:hypothetical protein [Oscillospiraceae bacterium]
MASPRYTLNITEEDLKPDEPIVLTKEEKRENWLHYHKWHIAFAVFMLVLVVWFIHDMVTRVLPDYQFAIVTDKYINSAAMDSLEDALSAELEDVNGDGQVEVTVVHYRLHYEEDFDRLDLSNKTYTEMQMADEQRISTDFAVSESLIFITDCFPGLQSQVPLFGFLEDPYAYPAEDELDDYDRMTINWTDSAFLSGLELPMDVVDAEAGTSTPAQEFFSDFQVCMRTLFDHTDEDLTTRFGGCVRLMRRIRQEA